MMKGYSRASCNIPFLESTEYDQGKLAENPHLLLDCLRKRAETGADLTPKELELALELAGSLGKSDSRDLTREFNRLLLSPAVFRGLNLFLDTGVLKELLPELVKGKGVEQSFIHPDDVLTHNFRTCALVKPELPLRLAALLHDIGKPGYHVEDPLVGRRFPGHHRRSAQMVPHLLARFDYPEEMVHRVRLLVENHMFIWSPRHGLEPLRELMKRVGEENIEDLIELVTSDREAIWGDRIAAGNKALRKALLLVRNKESRG